MKHPSPSLLTLYVVLGYVLFHFYGSEIETTTLRLIYLSYPLRKYIYFNPSVCCGINIKMIFIDFLCSSREYRHKSVLKSQILIVLSSDVVSAMDVVSFICLICCAVVFPIVMEIVKIANIRLTTKRIHATTSLSLFA